MGGGTTGSYQICMSELQHHTIDHTTNVHNIRSFMDSNKSAKERYITQLVRSINIYILKKIKPHLLERVLSNRENNFLHKSPLRALLL